MLQYFLLAMELFVWHSNYVSDLELQLQIFASTATIYKLELKLAVM